MIEKLINKIRENAEIIEQQFKKNKKLIIHEVKGECKLIIQENRNLSTFNQDEEEEENV